MKNLTDELSEVYSAKGITNKLQSAIKLVEASHAKKETKTLAILQLNRMKSENQIDNFMTNYMLSGEGLKV